MACRIVVPTQPPGPLRSVAIAVALVAAAALFRLALHPLVLGNGPFIPFLGAALLATLWGDERGGILAALLGGLVAEWLFVPALESIVSPVAAITVFATYIAMAFLVVAVTSSMVASIRRERGLNQRLQVVSGELEHRVRNVLTVTQGLMQQAARSATTLQDFLPMMEQRLSALAEAQDLLAKAEGGPIQLRTLVDKIFAPFALADRLEHPINGPAVEVSPEVGVALALLLNELATNATKYGALSIKEGRVSFFWEARETDVSICWKEAGGPLVAPPTKQGFGSRLFKTALPEQDGKVEVAYEPQGVHAHIRLRPA